MRGAQSPLTRVRLRSSYRNSPKGLLKDTASHIASRRDGVEEVKIPVEPNQMVTAELVGSSLKLNYCGMDKAIALLREQYAVKTMEIRIVQSKI
ncbi:MAG: hypothetical protein HC930_00520 [Hydrococcus sp. SU_1_0]|nr:hypothetical protein [Hydrococcus sp. SU_1_0]